MLIREKKSDIIIIRERSEMALTQQPDSLKLSATLCVLRHLHKVAEEIEAEYGDKSAESAFFHCGVQGKVTKHSAERDYDYFIAKAAEVREHLEDNLVQDQIAELASTALEIYNRCENRRRMGLEVVILSFLVNRRSSWLEIPEKYHSKTFVMDMLVSCRLEKCQELALLIILWSTI